MALTLVSVKKKQTIRVNDKSGPGTATDFPTIADINKAIDCTFVIGANGLINGQEGDLIDDVENATHNMKWNTLPFFSINFEEVQLLRSKVNQNAKDRTAID